MLVQILVVTVLAFMENVMALAGPVYEFQRVLSILLYSSGSVALFVLR